MPPIGRRLLRPRLRSVVAIALLLGIGLPGQALGQPGAPSATPTVQTGPVLVADDFQNPDRGLLPHASVDPDNYEQGYESGYYVIRAVDEEWNGSVDLALPGSYRDTRLSVNVRSLGDRAGAVYLECRRGPDTGYGAVLFLDSGNYWIGRVQNGSATPLTRPSSSPYGRLRHTGMHLALTCVGDRISLSFDGIELAAARDMTNGEGRLRVGVETLRQEDIGSLEFRFSNLVATEVALSPESTPAQTVTPTATATPAATSSAAPAVTPATRTPTPVPLTEADVAAMISPSVVRISSSVGMGSGVKIGEGLLTNEHVVRGQQQVQIQRSDGSRQTATVVRSDPWFDLALLTTDLEIPALQIETAANQRQGDQVLVLGYPGALPGQATLTRGLLSAVREIEGVTLVQTDAAVTFGSSGGAIVNMRGKLIGVTQGALGLTGSLNFGIAGESVKAFLDGAQIVAPDAAEPDNTPQQARPLVIGAAPEPRNLHVPGDVDWVSLAVAEGDEVAIFTDAGRCDTLLRLYAPDGVTLLDSDDDGGRGLSSWIEFTAEETGTYYASISHLERGGSCRSYYLAARLLT